MACAFTSLKLVDVQPSFKCSSLMPAGSNVSAGSLTDPRTAPKAWQGRMSFSTGEQQRSNDSAAVSRGREVHGEPQSLPEQIALRKMIFPLFPAFVPATRERVSESKPSVAGRRTAWRRGLHPPPAAACRHTGVFTDLGVIMAFFQPGLWGLGSDPGSFPGCVPGCIPEQKMRWLEKRKGPLF